MMPRKIRRPIFLAFFIVSLFSLILIYKRSFISDTFQIGEVVAQNDKKDLRIIDSRSWSNGLVFNQSSVEPPIITLSTENINKVKVKIYSASMEDVLDYLTYTYSEETETSEFIKLTEGRSPNKGDLVVEFEEVIDSEDEKKDVLLPTEGKGIWLLEASAEGITKYSYIIRSEYGTIVKEGENDLIFWGLSFKDNNTVTSGTLSFYNLNSGINKLGEAKLEGEFSKYPLSQSIDVAIFDKDGDKNMIPVNLRYSYYYFYGGRFEQEYQKNETFVFTDRPIYKPGDSIKYKAILRRKLDNKYFVPSGGAKVRIYKSYWRDDSNIIYESDLAITDQGTSFGEFEIPKSIKTGFHYIYIEFPDGEGNMMGSGQNFLVEHYRKPEYTVSVDTPQIEYISGDGITLNVEGKYFFGQPLSNVEVKYKVMAVGYSTPEHYSKVKDKYVYFPGWEENLISEGVSKLDKQGKGIINLGPDVTKVNDNMVFQVIIEVDDGLGNPSASYKNVIVYSGAYGIYRSDHKYSSSLNEEVVLPVELAPYLDESYKLDGIKLSAKIVQDKYIEVNDNDPDAKYKRYEKLEVDRGEVSALTNSEGKAEIRFLPKEAGGYNITVSGVDQSRNKIEKVFSLFVYNPQNATDGDWPGEEYKVKIETDKDLYTPGETAQIKIISDIKDTDVLVSLGRTNVKEYRVVKVSNHNGYLEVPIKHEDIPNTWISVNTVAPSHAVSDTQMIKISTDSKKLDILIEKEDREYSPGEDVEVKVKTTVEGKPVSADLALWVVDKALFEVKASNLGDVLSHFWDTIYLSIATSDSLIDIVTDFGGMGGGCFTEDTKVLLPNDKNKKISEVKPGDTIITLDENNIKVEATVKDVHSVSSGGYITINDGLLKITPEHILKINDIWQTAGSLQIGDALTDKDGNEVKVYSLIYQKSNEKVYNLYVEKYHTFIANGILVHNDKGDSRDVLEDLAYWNPSVRTDANGEATIIFKLPDNLTTWVISTLGSTTETQVGQNTSELTVSKEVIARPILPNLIRIGDKLNISALVHNFTDHLYTFETQLISDYFNIKKPRNERVKIGSKDVERVSWEVTTKEENAEAKVTISTQANGSDYKDSITQGLPILPFGFEDRRVEKGINSTTFNVKLSENSKLDRAKISLNLAPTFIQMLPQTAEYLIKYPYGCTEQVVSRLSALLTIYNNPVIYQDIDLGNDLSLTENINKAIEDVEDKASYGGWSWWKSSDDSNISPFLTAYTLDVLLDAQQSGFDLNDSDISFEGIRINLKEMYNKIEKPESKISVLYGLSIINQIVGRDKANDSDRFYQLINHMDYSVSPDFKAIISLTNINNGYTDSGIVALSQTAISSPEQAFGRGVSWEAGNKEYFGSSNASAALVIRALTKSGGYDNLINEAITYLARNRNNTYWSNTFASAQILKALSSHKSFAQNPNYQYEILLDGNPISSGKIESVNHSILPIEIDTNFIDEKGSSLEIKVTGDGDLYSTLSIDEFITSTRDVYRDSGLKVNKWFEASSDGRLETYIKEGDIVNVYISIEGLNQEEMYGVIVDELPSNLIPINANLDNEILSKTTRYFDGETSQNVRITENGAVILLDKLMPGRNVYVYKARAVVSGTALVPPARAELMYAPGVNGLSDVGSLTIFDKDYMSIADRIAEIIAQILFYIVTFFRILRILILLGMISSIPVFIVAKIKKVSFLQVLSGIKNRVGKVRKSNNKEVPEN